MAATRCEPGSSADLKGLQEVNTLERAALEAPAGLSAVNFQDIIARFSHVGTKRLRGRQNAEGTTLSGKRTAMDDLDLEELRNIQRENIPTYINNSTNVNWADAFGSADSFRATEKSQNRYIRPRTLSPTPNKTLDPLLSAMATKAGATLSYNSFIRHTDALGRTVLRELIDLDSDGESTAYEKEGNAESSTRIKPTHSAPILKRYGRSLEDAVQIKNDAKDWYADRYARAHHTPGFFKKEDAPKEAAVGCLRPERHRRLEPRFPVPRRTWNTANSRAVNPRSPRLFGSVKMKPKDIGSFKVKNTLAQTPSTQAVYSREKPFDLQNGKHNPPRTRTSLPNHNKVIVLEAGESAQPNRRASLTRSSQSHQNVGSNGVVLKRDTGVQEYRVVEDNVNPRRKRERRKNSQPSTNGNSGHSASREGSNSMEPAYTAVRLDDAFEDPDDRIEVIYDNEETKRPSKKPKHSNTSRYFDEKDELSIHDSSQISEGHQNYRPSGKGKRPKVQQDGQKDLSRSSTKYETIHNLDDLQSSRVSSGDASHLMVARTLLAKQRQYKQLSSSDDEKDLGSQGGSQSSDDYKRVESDIKPSTFETKLSKNGYNHPKLDPGPSKIGKRKRGASNNTTAQQEYHACRILESSSEGLVCDLQPSPCLLLHEATKARLLRRHESVPRLPDIVLEGLNRIEFSTDSPLIFLHFHRNLSSDSQLLILCLLLQNNKESAGLREALCQADSAIKKISKDKAYLEKCFRSRVRELEKNKGPNSSCETIDDSQLSAAKKKSSVAKVINEALESKRPATRQRLIDDLQLEIPPTRSSKRQQAASASKLSTISSGTFYGSPGEGRRIAPMQYAIRSSDSVEEDDDPVRERDNPDTLELWTVQNPDWKKSWQGAVPSAPGPGTRNRVMVEQSDIEKLDEGVYLNDNLVQFYLNWLESEHQKSAPENAKRIFVFNTFFYTQLTKSPNKGHANHASVARWTSRFDLFSYDYLIVPICEHIHWYFAIICNPQKLLPRQERGIGSQDSIRRDRDDETDELGSDLIEIPNPTEQKSLSRKGNKKIAKRILDPSQFRIITFDSLGISRSAVCSNLKTYLVAELQDKRNIEIPVPGSIGMTARLIPLQENGCDCGLFLSGYVEKFLQNPDEFIRNVVQNTIPIDDDYWPNFRGMRKKIRDLLLGLQAQQIAVNDQIRQANRATRANKGTNFRAKSAGPSHTPSSSNKVEIVDGRINTAENPLKRGESIDKARGHLDRQSSPAYQPNSSSLADANGLHNKRKLNDLQKAAAVEVDGVVSTINQTLCLGWLGGSGNGEPKPSRLSSKTKRDTCEILESQSQDSPRSTRAKRGQDYRSLREDVPSPESYEGGNDEDVLLSTRNFPQPLSTSPSNQPSSSFDVASSSPTPFHHSQPGRASDSNMSGGRSRYHPSYLRDPADLATVGNKAVRRSLL